MAGKRENFLFSKLFFVLVLVSLFVYCGNSQGKFSGEYELNSGNTILKLTFSEDSNGLLKGTLSGNNGVSFTLEGIAKGETAEGKCKGRGLKLFFEAKLKDNQLILDFIEPRKNNKPDYSKTKRLAFTKKPEGTEIANKIIPQNTLPNKNDLENTENTKVNRNLSGENYSENLSSKTISNPSWGFNVKVSSGWKFKKGANAIILGHDRIAGAIFVFPHILNNISQVRNNLAQGISNESMRLYLSGNIVSVSNNILSGDYSGTLNGTPVKAKGYGTLSPHGEGAFIIAITTPDKYGKELVSAALLLTKRITYNKTQNTNLIQYFAGTWKTVTKNTETIAVLYPNGRFSMRYSSAYSGTNGGWGAAGDENSSGKWTVRGNRRQGVLILTYTNGGQETINYYVHTKNGETYWREYYFGGTLYWKVR